jgi:methionyl aminopeptidase
MIYIKTDEEIEYIRQSSLLVGKALAQVAELIQPGVTTLDLDRRAEEFIRDNRAIPAFLGYSGFPNTLCTSINDRIVHGIPNSIRLQDGDIVSVDCGVLMNGFYGDSAYTFCVGDVKEETRKLLQVTKEALYLGIGQSVHGGRVGDIGYAVQEYCERHSYSVVRELVGHGVGRKLHEAPEVPNYGRRGTGPVLKSGMVIAIEPMINQGSRNLLFEKDGWTTRTKDGKMSAHFEHTIAVRHGKAEVLSSFEFIDQVLNTNS